MDQLNLHVGGMSCRRCVREVTARLRDVPGVETVSADPGDCIVWLSGSMQLDDVLAVFVSTTDRPELIDRRGASEGDDNAGRDGDSGGTAAGKSER